MSLRKGLTAENLKEKGWHLKYAHEVLDSVEKITPLAYRLLKNVTLPATGIRLLGLSVSKTEQEIREDYLAKQMTLFWQLI